MIVQPITSIALHTDYRKKWLYATTAAMKYWLDMPPIEDCDIWHERRLLGTMRGNVLTIEKGYAFDGMTNFPDTADNMCCALLHDFLYQTALLPRRTADQILTQCMKTTGANHRRLVYAGVRLFGWLHFGKESGIRIVKL